MRILPCLIFLISTGSIGAHERFDAHFDEVLTFSEARDLGIIINFIDGVQNKTVNPMKRRIRVSFPPLITGQHLSSGGFSFGNCRHSRVGEIVKKNEEGNWEEYEITEDVDLLCEKSIGFTAIYGDIGSRVYYRIVRE